jgi:hypothetical protein
MGGGSEEIGRQERGGRGGDGGEQDRRACLARFLLVSALIFPRRAPR